MADFRFASLGSGSKGNAWVVQAGRTTVMVDCGFGPREAARRLARLGLAAEDLDALLVTHEHGDHGRGVANLAAKARCPVWLSHGCHAMLEALGSAPISANILAGHAAFALGDLQVTPYPVPHDAREPVQFTFSDGARRFGLLTDAGHVTPHMEAVLDGCAALALECNHDVAMLQAGSYPVALRRRILGPFGHLDNAAAAVCGMVKNLRGHDAASCPRKFPVALSMLGTVTQGAMRAKRLLREKGYDAIAFHQNGTGGIAMEEMIREGIFKGVLDLNLHELGDSVANGLHASIGDGRLTAAGALGIPQVVVPGSINYAVMGPVETLLPEIRERKYIVHNSQLTLVRLTREELQRTAVIMADRLNMAKGPTHVFIPLRGFSYPDHPGRGHWDPEDNGLFIRALKARLSSSIPYDEIDRNINDDAFIDTVVEALVRFMNP